MSENLSPKNSRRNAWLLVAAIFVVGIGGMVLYFAWGGQLRFQRSFAMVSGGGLLNSPSEALADELASLTFSFHPSPETTFTYRGLGMSSRNPVLNHYRAHVELELSGRETFEIPSGRTFMPFDSDELRKMLEAELRSRVTVEGEFSLDHWNGFENPLDRTIRRPAKTP